MTIDENQTKPPIFHGLPNFLRLILMTPGWTAWNDEIMAWIEQVESVQSAITQVGEEE